MTVRDPNDDKYVATTPNAVKKGDQNTAVIGPARVQDEEETQQQIDKGVAQASFTSSVLQGKVKLGQLAPDYWHTSKYLTGTTLNSTYTFTDSGLLYPILVTETSTIDAMAIYVVTGTATVFQNEQAMRLGIYNEVDGLPFLLLMETNEFNPANGSIPNNTFHIEEFGASLELRPGRYWLARRRKNNSIGASGTLARAHGRTIHKTGFIVHSILSTNIASEDGGFYFNWADGTTSLPAVFDINDYTAGHPPYVADTARPEIYLRAVENA